MADFDFISSFRWQSSAPTPRPPPDGVTVGMDNVIDFINVNRERYLEELMSFLASPSVSALPQHAVEAHLKQNARLPANMRFILEGEEEVGSANLDDFIRAHKDELQADVVVISDSPMFARGVPSICYGLRGLVYFQIDLRGSSTDLHSGSFGGAVANPAFVLSQMIAQMKDRGGRIRIPGFYDDVAPLQEEERKAWASLPFNEKKFKK